MNVQLLLLCAGVAHRHSPSFLARLARSSAFLGGVSNRLAAPSHRARFLGMVVGESLSALAGGDSQTRLSFGSDETLTADARRWKALPSLNDCVGSLQDLSAATVPKKRRAAPRCPAPAGPCSAVRPARPDSDAGSDARSDAGSDAEFAPYALPDSDPEDAPDDDATTVDRNKPTPPVYVAALICPNPSNHICPNLIISALP